MFFYSMLFIPLPLFRENRGMQGQTGIKSNFRVTPSLPHALPDGMIPKMTLGPGWSHLQVALHG